MTTKTSNDFYRRRRASHETNGASTAGISSVTNDMSTADSNDKLLNHIESHVTSGSGQSFDTSELLNLLETKDKKYGPLTNTTNDARSAATSSSVASRALSASSSAMMSRASSNAASRGRRMLLEQDAAAYHHTTGSTNNSGPSLADHFAQSYNSSIELGSSRRHNNKLMRHADDQSSNGGSGGGSSSSYYTTSSYDTSSSQSSYTTDGSWSSWSLGTGSTRLSRTSGLHSINSTSSTVSTSSSLASIGTTMSLFIETCIQTKDICRYSKRRFIVMIFISVLLVITSLSINISLGMIQEYNGRNEMMMNDGGGSEGPSRGLPIELLGVEQQPQQQYQQQQGGGGETSTVEFHMCKRKTPFTYNVKNNSNDNYDTTQAQEQHATTIINTTPLIKFDTNWDKSSNKLLLLRNDGKFGHIGNQINSLFHAIDYAIDNKLHLGILFHSWTMDVIHSLWYEVTSGFEDLEVELLNDFGIVVIRNHLQLNRYNEVISRNAQQLYFYQGDDDDNVKMKNNNWKEKMERHGLILQRLYLRYNRGYGFVHNGSRAQDVCTTLDMLFHDNVGEVKYSVIHSRYLDNNAMWRLEEIAKTAGMTLSTGATNMGPAYVKSILEPLGMLNHPIILITDGKLPNTERDLQNDPIIGPKLMVLNDKGSLDGADVALAVLSDVFIGNPASLTSGFIARSRMALGYSYESTQLFRTWKPEERTWHSVCDEECFFNPHVLGHWV